MITVIGSINADLKAQVERHPHPGETLLGSGGYISAGGKGANQAVAASLLGAQVSLVGAVGNDAYVQPATKNLRAAGVDLSHVVEVQQPTGLAIITVDNAGENSIIVIPGANSTMTDQAVAQHTEVIKNADIVLLQGEIPASGFAEAIKLSTHRVVVNLAPVIDVDRDALLQADPIIANEHEAGLILNQLGVHCPSEKPEDLCTALLSAGFHSVVLTLGAQGAAVADSQGFRFIPTPVVTAVDTTGAGDAFTGAFVAKLDEGLTIDEAATFAARVGAFAATGEGAQDSYPQATDVLPS
ncbi:sugar kinase, ribokinase [Corynebacterium kutscheri]|uniref:Ribokinase n=1 Tax=Corynebacterium kutscheri TaxID=35755 RepID=A0A0F6TEW5_9CORY|nr:ribokinase [Corynebacterium kutscheri]AKE42161.1 sugar kinase, ribokinase [Corynebacterium kutscheri]VEH10504.1 ribokinase [Corynebacterium kutscheri]